MKLKECNSRNICTSLFLRFASKYLVYLQFCILFIVTWGQRKISIVCTLGWPKTIKHLPKCVRFTNFEQFWIAKIILHWSHFNHFFLNHCLGVAHLILSFAYFCIIPKENILFEELSLLRLCVSTLPRKRITWNTMFSFGVMQNFRSNARPLNSSLELNAFYNFNVEWSQLFKSVWNLQIGHILVFGHP